MALGIKTPNQTAPMSSDIREAIVQLNNLSAQVRAAFVVLDAAAVSGWSGRTALLDAAVSTIQTAGGATYSNP